ncbi:MAG TPA: metallophosphoesterase [Bacilli bacterium]|nr:metallophosphoesterase [Bacilli bacterium]
MRNKFKILLPLILLVLSGCENSSSSGNLSSSVSTSEKQSEVISSSETSEVIPSSETSSSEEVPPVTSDEPLSSSEEIPPITSEVSSNTSEEISSSSSEHFGDERTINFYGLNDFHGAIIETDNEPGIFKYSSFLKEKITENPGGTVHLNAGDFWQGSVESNLNRGEFLTKAMNELSLDAFALGNHEFDWYDTAIMDNKAIANYPFLGANIINKSTGELAQSIVHYDDTFQASHMVNKNGVNIGIIGTIGSDLESSILGLAIADYSFEPVTSYVKNESLNLREQGADIVILVTHDSLKNFTMSHTYNEYYDIFANEYVDAVFSGHQHVEDNRVLNGIPVLQAWAYGGGVMELELNYNVRTKEKVFTHQAVRSGWDIKRYEEDPAMKALFAPYEDEIETVKNEVIGSLTSNITKEGLLNLANQVMYEYGVNAGLENIVVTHNRGGVRLNAGISGGDVIFGDIYRAFPFDNELMIIPNVLGSDLNRFIRGDYKGYPQGSYEANKRYTLLTLDFMSYREGAFTLELEQISTQAYIRDLIRDYFLSEGVVDANYFNSY